MLTISSEVDSATSAAKRNNKGRKRSQTEEVIAHNEDDVQSSSRKRGRTTGDDKHGSKPMTGTSDGNAKTLQKLVSPFSFVMHLC